MSLLDQGLAVFSGLGLDSMVINQALQTEPGKALTKAGMRYAASGGSLRKGILVWNGGNERLKFHMNPEAITDAKSPVWAETVVPGQNRPMYQFINGGPRELNFTLNYFYNERRREHVRDDIRKLQSLTDRPGNYATDAGGSWQGVGGQHPPIVYFFFGEYYEGVPFIVSKIQVTSKDLFDPARLLPMRADVDLTLWEVQLNKSSDSAPVLGAREQLGGAGEILGASGIL